MHGMWDVRPQQHRHEVKHEIKHNRKSYGETSNQKKLIITLSFCEISTLIDNKTMWAVLQNLL